MKITHASRLDAGTLSIMALAAGCALQVGGQFFAISVVVSTLTASLPASLAMVQGPYGYDSSRFWEIVPSVNSFLFLVALILNWRTPRRTLIGLAAAFFLLSGVVAVVIGEPLQATVLSGGPPGISSMELQSLGERWRRWDWIAWGLAAVGGGFLVVALARPRA